MEGPVAYLSTPPSFFFLLPPSSEPRAVPPNPSQPSFRAPFRLNPDVYEAPLSPQIPISFALIYMAAISAMNRLNRRRAYKPWSISKSRLFHIFVVLHNILLALYSGITCAAMVRALNVSFVSPFQAYGLAASADSLCRMLGPRGLGDAVLFDPAQSRWTSMNHHIHLANAGSPDFDDVGRIWNEGLAFWGWVFYLSKFYEVVDTLVILAKGKRSSTLQTYHHAGAMLSVWSGIRYMSPPIWMFVLVNAGIHTFMVSPVIAR